MLRRMLLALTGALLLGSVAVGLTAASTVPPTKLEDTQSPIIADTLAPGICAPILLTSLVTGDAAIVAGGFQQLILGGPAAQNITGTAGRDCIHGGDGADVINGGGDNDVCIGSALAVFASCETQIVW